MEKEHIANCGSFKAVSDVKPPYENIEFLTDQYQLFKTELIHLNEKDDDLDVTVTLFKEKSLAANANKDFIHDLENKSPIKSNFIKSSFTSVSNDLNFKNFLTEPLLQKTESTLSKNKNIEIELPIMSSHISETDKFDEIKSNAFKLFKKASQLEMTNENLVNAKKNPFNFEEWLSEISEFKHHYLV